MIFANVKSITIPEGVVAKIMSGANVLWEKVKEESGYTNLVKTAATNPGGTDIYNGTGYKNDYRWSNSGKKETATTNGRISGWMSFEPNATYRIKNFYGSKASYNTGLYFVLYFSDGTYKSYEHSRLNAEYDANTDTYTIQHSDNALYFRVSGYKGDNEPIITVNEEITE